MRATGSSEPSCTRSTPPPERRVWEPIALGGRGYWPGHAYDAGRVVTLSDVGLLRARDSATGRLLWSVLVQETVLSTPPVAAYGGVYVVGAQTLYAFDASTGELLYQQLLPRQGVS